MRANIIVFKEPNSTEVIYRFKFIEQLIAMNNRRNWSAHQISINGQLMMSWDELESLAKQTA